MDDTWLSTSFELTNDAGFLDRRSCIWVLSCLGIRPGIGLGGDGGRGFTVVS